MAIMMMVIEALRVFRKTDGVEHVRKRTRRLWTSTCTFVKPCVLLQSIDSIFVHRNLFSNLRYSQRKILGERTIEAASISNDFVLIFQRPKFRALVAKKKRRQESGEGSKRLRDWYLRPSVENSFGVAVFPAQRLGLAGPTR